MSGFSPSPLRLKWAGAERDSSRIWTKHAALSRKVFVGVCVIKWPIFLRLTLPLTQSVPKRKSCRKDPLMYKVWCNPHRWHHRHDIRQRLYILISICPASSQVCSWSLPRAVPASSSSSSHSPHPPHTSLWTPIRQTGDDSGAGGAQPERQRDGGSGFYTMTGWKGSLYTGMCLVSVETLLDAIKHNNIMSVQLWPLILAAEKQDVCS